MNPRGLLSVLRVRIARRIFLSTHLDEGYGTRDASGEAPPEHSPAALSARLDAVERLIAERNLDLARLKKEHELFHVTTKRDTNPPE